MLKHKWLQSKWLALGWLLLISILFFLPGSAFPEETWLSKIYFDKLVHAGLFAVLVFLWRASFGSDRKGFTILLLCGCFAYGLMVEFIQRDWIPNRDFDLYDVAADMAGSIIGILLWVLYKKNKPL
jgi:VanZ family protein